MVFQITQLSNKERPMSTEHVKKGMPENAIDMIKKEAHKLHLLCFQKQQG